MTRLAALALVVVLASCAKAALKTEASNNTAFEVATLFTHDGCTVYRFKDAGELVYFARCGGQAAPTTAMHRRSCGRNCTRIVPQLVFALPERP